MISVRKYHVSGGGSADYGYRYSLRLYRIFGLPIWWRLTPRKGG